MKKDVRELLSTAKEEEQHREEWRLRLALMKESTGYRDFWDDRGAKALQAHKHIQDFYARHGCTGGMSEEVTNAFFSECEEALHALAMFNGPLREQFGIDIGGYVPNFRRDEWFNRLNPYRLNDQTIVRFYYPLPAISQVEGGPIEEIPCEHHFRTPFSSIERNKLKPSERLLRVDLSRKRSELLQEFNLFLDLVEAHRTGGDVPETWKLNYATWEPNNSRFFKEAWQALEVWRLRRKRKTYSEIARTLYKRPDYKNGLQTAKMAFRRAYELIEGKPYRPEAFKRENLPVSTSELGKTCLNCSIKNTCTELCPDMLRYVNQDIVSQRELTVDSRDPYGPAEYNEDTVLALIDDTE